MPDRPESKKVNKKEVRDARNKSKLEEREFVQNLVDSSFFQFKTLAIQDALDEEVIRSFFAAMPEQGEIFHKFFRQQIENAYKKIFSRMNSSKTFEEKKRLLEDKADDILHSIDYNMFVDCLYHEFNLPSNVNFLLNPENIKNVNERLFEILIERHNQTQVLSTEYSQEIADQTPEVLIPTRYYTDKNGKAYFLTVHNLNLPAFVAETGIKANHCVGDNSQKYSENVVTRPGEYYPRNLILTLEEMSPEKKPIGYFLKTKGIESKRAKGYEDILTDRFPILTIEVQILNASKPTIRDGKKIARIAQVKFASNKVPQRSDDFTMDIFVKQILPEIAKELQAKNFELRSFGPDLNHLAPQDKSKLLTISGKDKTLKEVLQGNPEDVVIAGREITPTPEDLGKTVEEQKISIRRMCNLSNVRINLVNLQHNQELLNEITSVRGDLILSKLQIINLPNLENVDGALFVEHSKNIKLPKLRIVGDHLQGSKSNNIEVPNLISVRLLNIPDSANIHFHSLEHVDQSIIATDTENITFDKLKEVQDSIHVSGCSNVHFKSLEVVHGKNIPADNSVFNTITAVNSDVKFEALKVVNGNVDFSTSSNVNAPKLLIINGDMTMETNVIPHIFPMLHEVHGDVLLNSSTKIAFPNLKKVFRSLHMMGCSMIDLPRLESVTYSLHAQRWKNSPVFLPKLVNAGQIDCRGSLFVHVPSLRQSDQVTIDKSVKKLIVSKYASMHDAILWRVYNDKVDEVNMISPTTNFNHLCEMVNKQGLRHLFQTNTIVIAD